jgi:hypothetical protein
MAAILIDIDKAVSSEVSASYNMEELLTADLHVYRIHATQ